MIFQTNPNGSFNSLVTQITFHLSDNSRKLVKITFESAPLIQPIKTISYVLAGSPKTPDEEWNFKFTQPNELEAFFKRLALENPEDFKELYYILKKHDEKMFPIINCVLQEVQQLFNFS